MPGVGVPGHHRKPAAGEAKGYIGISYFLRRFFDSLRIIWHYCTLIDPSGSSGVESDTFSLSDPSLLFQFPGERNSWHPGRRLPVNRCKFLLSACAPQFPGRQSRISGFRPLRISGAAGSNPYQFYTIIIQNYLIHRLNAEFEGFTFF